MPTTGGVDEDFATIADPAHSETETRHIIVGRSHEGKLLVVIHTERGDSIRIISARRASRRERKSYEEPIS
ncbi:MAG: BrnT family toxin [Verrucomicrobiota bacterium]